MAEEIQSNFTPELAAALAKCQGALSSVGKDREVKGTYSFKYATLSAIWDVVRKPLAENGLSVIQLPSIGERKVFVETRLQHASGGWVSSLIEMPVAQQTPQGIGSALSYARRYALSAMLGVVSDDDDDDGLAAAASTNTVERRQPSPTPRAQVTQYSKPNQSPAPQAQAKAAVDDGPPPPPPAAGPTLADKCAEHAEKIKAATDIRALQQLGLQIGPSFAGHADPATTKPMLDSLRAAFKARETELRALEVKS